MAGGGGDYFLFEDGATLSGSLSGSGNDTFDYGPYSTSVVVDLQIGFATGVRSSVIGIGNVYGGNGGPVGSYNILVGNGGNVLIGGYGRRNLFIAGAWNSTFIGGDDDDILIGGTTAYDRNLTALMAIMAEWTQPTSYVTRVNNLLYGTGLSPLLDATTVFNNGGNNWLQGDAGGPTEMNLFYGMDPPSVFEAFTDWDPSRGEIYVPI